MTVEVDEKYLDEKIKIHLSAFSYREYEDEENGEYAYEFSDSIQKKKLLILIDDRATVYYADSHCHYEFYREEIDRLIEEVLKILTQKLKVVKVYSAKRWLGDFWVPTDEKISPAQFIQANITKKEFLNELKRLGGKIEEYIFGAETLAYSFNSF